MRRKRTKRPTMKRKGDTEGGCCAIVQGHRLSTPRKSGKVSGLVRKGKIRLSMRRSKVRKMKVSMPVDSGRCLLSASV